MGSKWAKRACFGAKGARRAHFGDKKAHFGAKRGEKSLLWGQKVPVWSKKGPKGVRKANFGAKQARFGARKAHLGARSDHFGAEKCRFGAVRPSFGAKSCRFGSGRGWRLLSSAGPGGATQCPGRKCQQRRRNCLFLADFDPKVSPGWFLGSFWLFSAPPRLFLTRTLRGRRCRGEAGLRFPFGAVLRFFRVFYFPFFFF